MKPAITVSKLVKEFGNFKAVNDISFEVMSGTTFAFLGTNGAGKTTTISCITTITAPTSGEIIVNGKKIGHDDADVRKDIGVVFQQSLLDPLLTVDENLRSRAAFYGIGEHTDARIKELSELIDLGGILKKRYGKLSGGQKRRADIARALLHNPSILFLDEPTAGLDPQSREKVWDTINQLQKATNLTVFLTTHYMEETERADSVYVIDQGSIIASGTPTQLRNSYSKDLLSITATDPQMLIKALKQAKLSFVQHDDVFAISVTSSKDALNFIKQHEAIVSDFEFRHGSMDDVFLSLTDKERQ